MYRVVKRVVDGNQICGLLCRDEYNREQFFTNNELEQLIDNKMVDVKKDKRGYRFLDKKRKIGGLGSVSYNNMYNIDTRKREFTGYRLIEFAESVKIDKWVWNSEFMDKLTGNGYGSHIRGKVIVVAGMYGATDREIFAYITRYMIDKGYDADYITYIKYLKEAARDNDLYDMINSIQYGKSYMVMAAGITDIPGYINGIKQLNRTIQYNKICPPVFLYVPGNKAIIKGLAGEGCKLCNMVKGVKH